MPKKKKNTDMPDAVRLGYVPRKMHALITKHGVETNVVVRVDNPMLTAGNNSLRIAIYGMTKFNEDDLSQAFTLLHNISWHAQKERFPQETDEVVPYLETALVSMMNDYDIANNVECGDDVTIDLPDLDSSAAIPFSEKTRKKISEEVLDYALTIEGKSVKRSIGRRKMQENKDIISRLTEEARGAP